MRTVWLLVLCAAPALAQEIGTETPTGTNTGTQRTDNPQTGPATPPPVGPTQHSAGRMSLGIRAGFGGNAIPAAPSAPTAASSAVPSLSFSFFLSDAFAIEVDLGFGLAILSNAVALGFGIGAGGYLYLRDTSAQVRPFVGGTVNFTKGFSASGEDFGLGIQLGGGLAYYFSPSFSVDARVLIGIPFSFARAFTIGFFTLSPGVGATVFL